MKRLENVRGLVSTYIINISLLLFISKIYLKIMLIFEAKAFPTVFDYIFPGVFVFFLPLICCQLGYVRAEKHTVLNYLWPVPSIPFGLCVNR